VADKEEEEEGDHKDKDKEEEGDHKVVYVLL
jgi:hypothetical protein